MMIVGLSGYAGSGKDTVADLLVKEHSFAKVSFADPLKRICRDVFDFSVEQLWGPSEERNRPDSRYPRKLYGSDRVETELLTPRHALQTLGTEWGRNCYPPIWVEYGMRIAKRLLTSNDAYLYDAQLGLHPNMTSRRVVGVVIPDVRFRNEMDAIREAGGKVVRVLRPGAGLTGQAAMHASEAEQAKISDKEFDYIIRNDSTLEALSTKVRVARTYF